MEPLSQLIRKLTDGFYSHSAVWDGQNVADGEYVVEATARGVRSDTLDFETGEQWYVDAWRWKPHPPNGHNLGDLPDYPSQPVTDEADSIAKRGVQFAYDELLMAALVVVLSRLPTEPLMRAAIRIGLSALEDWIHSHITGGKESMMCTAVVCTSFWEAPPNPKYAINISVDGSRAAQLLAAASQPPRPQVPPGVSIAERTAADYEELRRQCARLLLEAAGPAQRELLRRTAGRPWPRTSGTGTVLEPAGGPWVPVSCVTPRDLQDSPNLDFVGRLSEKAMPEMPWTALGTLVRLLGMP